MNCDYCHTDSDGFSTTLPRIGAGTAFIHHSPFDGWVIDISGPNKWKMKIPITCCPVCGRALIKQEEDNA